MDTSIARPSFLRSHSRLVVIFIAAIMLAAVLFGVLPASGAQAYSYTEPENTFVNLLNDYRVSKGLSPLLVSDMISEACYRHNHDMAKYSFFSHYSTKSDWFAANALPWDRMALSGYNYYTSKAENIAAGQRTALEVFNAWKASSGHNANMLNADMKVIGVSLYQLSGSPYTYYWTTDFGGYVDPTAHAVNAPPAPTVPRYQQTDLNLAYAGTWTSASATAASGGTFRYINAAGSCTVSFNGTSLAWLSKKKYTYGIAKLTLDGVSKGTVDLYSAKEVYCKVWETGTLPAGTHTLKIEWADAKNALSTNKNIAVDAFDIDGTIVPAPKPPVTNIYQQNNSNLYYGGTWTTGYSSVASGGSYRYANAAGRSCTVTFNGTSLAWLGKKKSTYGIAKLTLDGVSVGTVDLYSAKETYGKVWETGTLAAGTHTLTIEWTDAKNALSTNKNIAVDAFQIVGTIAKATAPR